MVGCFGFNGPLRRVSVYTGPSPKKRGGGGWSGGAKVLGNFQCRGVLLVWMIVGQGPIAVAVGADRPI